MMLSWPVGSAGTLLLVLRDTEISLACLNRVQCVALAAFSSSPVREST